MPVYEFVCENCGPFEQRRSFEEAGDPMACPSCGREARRVYSLSYVRRMPGALSGTIERSEKSAHEPELVRRPPAVELSSGREAKHGHGRPWTLGH